MHFKIFLQQLRRGRKRTVLYILLMRVAPAIAASILICCSIQWMKRN